MSVSRSTLVCFAVKEEAAPFQRALDQRFETTVLLTGIGRRNAERALRSALAGRKPDLVLTCGFAGALQPALTRGMIVFDLAGGLPLEAPLLAAGALRVRFHCADRVATTAPEKQALRQATGADAVEMESQAISAMCADQEIPCAIIRVILDECDEDLPLDFNQLTDENQRMDLGRLALAVARSPAKIPALLRLQKQSQAAADGLAQFLAAFLNLDPGKYATKKLLQ